MQNRPKSSCGTPLFLHLLRFMELLISLVVFLISLHHLQQDSGKQVVELDLGLGLEQHLEALYMFTSPLVIAGLALLFLSIFGSGKEVLLVRACVYLVSLSEIDKLFFQRVALCWHFLFYFVFSHDLPHKMQKKK